MRARPLLLFLAFLPGPLGAQASAPSPNGPRVAPALSAGVWATEIAGKDRLFLGGWAGLVFGDRFTIGGGGVSMTENVELPGSEAGTGFDLGMGYGGLFLRYGQPLSSRVTAEGGILVGAGHAEVRDRLVGSELGADNFPLLEPELSLFFAPHPPFHIGLSVGYRTVWGVDDLPRVKESDLKGWATSFHLRVGGL